MSDHADRLGHEEHADPPRDEEQRRGQLLSLWYAVLGGPVAWALGFAMIYPMVDVACETKSTIPIHAATLVALAIAAGATWTAWGQWNRLGRPFSMHEGDKRGRSSFMAGIGLLLGGLFSLAIIVQWLGTLFLHPCMGV